MRRATGPEPVAVLPVANLGVSLATARVARANRIPNTLSRAWRVLLTVPTNFARTSLAEQSNRVTHILATIWFECRGPQ